MNLTKAPLRFSLVSKKLAFFFIIFAANAFAQDCPNVGFEDGTTSNWVCGIGTFGDKNASKCNQEFPVVISQNKCMDGNKDNPLDPADFASCRHTIVTAAAGTDPNSLNTVPCLAPKELFPTGVNVYSFRIGNSIGSANPTTNNNVAFAESMPD
ncbi:MAG TPA: hypothetical protein PK289_13145 [Bacteroidia bacterium]|jgi:hypothetical protein|nr:hypothetical protein [Bacteroidia bacterium]HRG53290.1 hypothetical protein [Bacteroidia bacterium]